MSTVGMIEVTGCNLRTLVQNAYAPSRQQGLGVFDPAGRSGGLSDDDAQKIIDQSRDDRLMAVSVDYVNGRSIKLRVRRDGDRLFINNSWYDHSDSQLAALLNSVGIDGEKAIAAARREYDDAKAKAVAAAIKLVDAAGGSFSVETYKDTEALSEDVRWGLSAGTYSEPPIFKNEYRGHGAETWTKI